MCKYLCLFCDNARGLIAIYTAFSAEELFDASFGAADTVWVDTFEGWVFFTDSLRFVILVLLTEEHKDKSHTDISAVCCLIKVVRTGVAVHVGSDFVYTG